jgi:hypothetical protein
VNTLLLLVGLVAVQPTDAGIDGTTASGLALDGGAVDEVAAPSEIEVGRRGRLRGQVLAKGSRGPIVSAMVVARTVDGQQTQAETDDDGRFELAVACGELALSVRAPGYEVPSATHDACVDSAPLQLRLVPRPDLPVYETTVTAKRDQPSVALRGPELTSTPGTLGDPLRTIESLPGVAVVAWPAPIYAIRGSNPGNTGYFLDQLEVPLLFHLALGPSVIHPYFFDNLSFYPGGYPAQFGRYVAGVVSAETRAARTDRAHVSAEVRLYDAGVLVSVPSPDGNGAVAAAFRYSYTGVLLSLLRNDVTLSYWDYQVRADRKVRGWALTLLAFGSGDDLSYRLANQAFSSEYKLQFHRISLRGRRAVGSGQLSVQLALGYDHSLAPIVKNTYSITASALGVFPRISYQRTSEHWDVQVGADGQAQWYSPTTNLGEAGVSDLGRKRRALLAGSYASATLRTGDRLTITPGLRWDSYTIDSTSRQHLGFRLSAQLALDAQTWLSASGGTFSQPPSLGVQLPAAQNFGLSLYGLQTSWQTALGITTKRLPGAELEVTGYLQRYVLTDLRDPALLEPDPLASDFLVRRDARSYGLEIMLRRPTTERLSGWISYTLSQNQRALGGGLIGPSDWDQRHILNAVVGYRVGAYTLGARGHYNSGRPVLVNGGQAETFVRLPAFYQLDLRSERRFLFNAFTLTTYFEVVNVTLTREVYQLSQDASGTITQQSLRVFLPSLGVRGEM